MGLFDIFKKQNIKLQRKESPKVMINKLDAYSYNTNRKYKEYAKDGYQKIQWYRDAFS